MLLQFAGVIFRFWPKFDMTPGNYGLKGEEYIL